MAALAGVASTRALAVARGVPLFVYGTLLQGFHNHRAWLCDQHTGEPLFSRTEAAVLPHARLYHFLDFCYPGVEYSQESIPASSTVAGDLMWLKPHYEADALRALDYMEGYEGPGHVNNEYERMRVKVRTAKKGQSQHAWVYVCSKPSVFRGAAATLAEAQQRAASRGDARPGATSLPQHTDNSVLVPDGDWRAFLRKHGLRDEPHRRSSA